MNYEELNLHCCGVSSFQTSSLRDLGDVETLDALGFVEFKNVMSFSW